MALRHSAAIPRRRHDGGFTLLEILVTLVVLGLLLATLSDGVSFGLHAWRTDQRIAGSATGLARTDRVLRQLIGGAEAGDPDTRAGGFTGTAHSLSFTTTLPDGVGAKGTGLADVTLERRTGGLVLLWRPHYRHWATVPPPPAADIVLDHVAALQFSFWQPSAAGGSWRAVWNAASPPPLVRVRLIPTNGGEAHWPDLVIPTKSVVSMR